MLLDATVCGATNVEICSPNTDVLTLLIQLDPGLRGNKYFVTETGKNHGTIQLSHVYNNELGSKKARALAGLHALSGSDHAGNGETQLLEAFQATAGSTLTALATLATATEFSDNTCAANS